jgi:hypothetical protein
VHGWTAHCQRLANVTLLGIALTLIVVGVITIVVKTCGLGGCLLIVVTFVLVVSLMIVVSSSCTQCRLDCLDPRQVVRQNGGDDGCKEWVCVFPAPSIMSNAVCSQPHDSITITTTTTTICSCCIPVVSIVRLHARLPLNNLLQQLLGKILSLRWLANNIRPERLLHTAHRFNNYVSITYAPPNMTCTVDQLCRATYRQTWNIDQIQ